MRQKDDTKLSWKETYQEMAHENEDWSEFKNTLLDGLDNVATNSIREHPKFALSKYTYVQKGKK